MSLKQVVNTKELWEPLKEEFERQMQTIKDNFSSTKDEVELRWAQGEIKRLKKLLRLREDVNGRE